METRSLSSPLTPFVRFAFAPVCIGWGFPTLRLILHPESMVFGGVKGGAPPYAGLAFAVLWFIVTGAAFAFGWGLKSVQVEGDQLVVSNFLRQARIPLRLISDVRWRRVAHGGSVALDFTEPTAFGRSVTFIVGPIAAPPGAQMRMTRETPMMRETRILREIRRAVQVSRAV